MQDFLKKIQPGIIDSTGNFKRINCTSPNSYLKNSISPVQWTINSYYIDIKITLTKILTMTFIIIRIIMTIIWKIKSILK